ncbi:hypothetical protein BDV95DRAFT_608318 [Massariosphaeria phaeospora]|uniref:Uncharacterized protein n=1 Tax=Massariosphaeria phaeospora TaxID=100035 RepID=A0A7C8M6Y1_9PLEO|nr:hypothetical protein BDV95DRAFT_608318 [Massariosphaeria phaeospora]
MVVSRLTGRDQQSSNNSDRDHMHPRSTLESNRKYIDGHLLEPPTAPKFPTIKSKDSLNIDSARVRVPQSSRTPLQDLNNPPERRVPNGGQRRDARGR